MTHLQATTCKLLCSHVNSSFLPSARLKMAMVRKHNVANWVGNVSGNPVSCDQVVADIFASLIKK